MQSSPLPWEQLCRHFSLAEIQSATKNFDDALVTGRGGFGKVYRGTIDEGSGTVAAIKRLDSSSKQGAPEFWAEIEILSKLRHCHLVSLIGYCNEFDEMILVYELMPRGTIDNHLHTVGTQLSWLQRLRICIGAARGLDYLHTGTGTHHGVIHRDVKSSNILLDHNWEAKISDFGLSKVGPRNQPSTFVSTAVRGTYGYLDPEYFSTGRLTRKSDVYAFGVVLLEVLCGRRAVDKSLDEEQWGLVGWAQDCIKEGKLEHIIDSSLRGQILLNCLKEYAQIVERCLHNRPKERPTMAEVVVGLEFALALQERPDFSEPIYSATPAGKITFIRKIQKFFFPSTVDADASPSRNNEKDIAVTNYNGIANKDPEVNKYGEIATEVPQSGVTPNLKKFSFSALKKVTRNFSPKMLLGEGDFGQVFKGWVGKDTYTPSSKAGAGIPVASKRRKVDSTQGHAQWEAQVNFLGKFDHPNIISLLGYCSKHGEHILVFEFMEKGSLLSHLSSKDPSKTLSWDVRLKIMIGAAQGLTFLHTVDNVLCRNLKSANILLDGDYNAKLAGFGMARSGLEDSATHISTRVMGTMGFIAPEYASTGHLSVKSDVFSFGVVLLEVLTGKRAIDLSLPCTEKNLVDWATPYLTAIGKRRLKSKREVDLSLPCTEKNLVDRAYLAGKRRPKSEKRRLMSEKRRLIKSIIDPRLEKKYPEKGAIEAAKLAHICTHFIPTMRPSMNEVLQTLQQISAIEDSRGN